MGDMPTETMHALLTRFRAPLLRRIRLMMGARARDQVESADFLQQVFLTALENIEHLRPLPEAQQLRWLTATARNRVRRSVRQPRERALACLTDSISRLQPGTSSDESPPRIVDRQERIEKLVDVLESLKKEHQQVIELRDFDGLSFAEIGQHLGRSEGAVQMLHARALMSLAESLKRRSDSWGA